MTASFARWKGAARGRSRHRGRADERGAGDRLRGNRRRRPHRPRRVRGGRRAGRAAPRARDDARRDHRGAQRVQPTRPRRRVLPHRAQVELRPEAGAEPAPALPRRQRRRVRARDVQGPRDHAARPVPLPRGVPDRGARDPVAARLRLHPRRVRARVGGARRRARAAAQGQAPGRRHDRPPPRRRRVHLRRGDGAARVARRTARPAPHEAAVPGDRRALRVADRGQQRRVDHDRAADHRDGRRGVREARARELDGDAGLLALGQRRAPGELRAPARLPAQGPDPRRRRRHRRRAHAQGRHPGRLVDADPDRRRGRERDARLRLALAGRHGDRVGGGDRDRRPLLHGAARHPRLAVLRARVVRQVHAVPRRHALADADPEEDRGGDGAHCGPRPAARRRRADQRHVPLPARRLRRDRGRELRREVPRGVPRAHRGGRLPVPRDVVARRHRRADGRPRRPRRPGRDPRPLEVVA